jgi:hypothetical protein
MEILESPIDGRAGEARHPGDEGNPSSSQLCRIDGSDEMLLSLT